MERVSRVTRALIVVAHPDDEAFFCAGLMRENHDWDFTVVCATHTQETPRHREMLDYLTTQHDNVSLIRTLGLQDTEGAVPTAAWYWELLVRLRAVKYHHRDSPWDVVFTHNRYGDYGHGHHIAINQAVHEMFSNVWEFTHPRRTGVGKQWSGLHMVTAQVRDKVDRLTPEYRMRWDAWAENHYELAQSLLTLELFTSDRGRWPT